MPGVADVLRRHDRIGLDTPVFIYQMEAATPFTAVATQVIEALYAGSFTGVTSVLTFMEILVKPYQLGRPEAALVFEVMLANYPNLVVANVDLQTARRAAQLRAAYRLRATDALQIAACIEQQATAFVTNDHGLRRVQELQVVMLSDFI